MYKFRKLEGEYKVNISTCLPDNSSSTYSAVIGLSASYRNVADCYIFELHTRKDVKLNDNPPFQLADVFMLRLSGTYYPIKLKVSPSGSIEKVVNFSEIKGRWETEAAKIMKEAPCIAYELYIETAKPNMRNAVSFLRALQKDSFIQLYFAGAGSHIETSCYNFPNRGKSVHYKLIATSTPSAPDEFSKTFHTEKNEHAPYPGHILYKYFDQRDILSVEAEFTCDAPDGQYIKKVNILNKHRTVKDTNKLHSFLFD